MRRIQVVLAVAAAMAVMVTASVAPAMAATNNNDTHLDRQDIRLDQQLLNQNDNFGFNNGFDDFGFNNGFDDFGFNNGFSFDSSCPFWGDTEGIVNQWDCFN